MLQQIILYLKQNGASYLLLLREHMVISLGALFTACLLGIPFGYLCTRYQKYEKYITGFFQVLRIIPSLAVLILLIPVMGTGIRPAMTALVLLAIPPILMNTAAGLKGVPEFMLETARGIGMTERQELWRVRFPLAFPLIFAGIKTAMVEIIASATLAAKIGAGGLGGLIFTGLGLNRTDLLLTGGISVAALSLACSLILDRIGRGIMKYKWTDKKKKSAKGTAAAILSLLCIFSLTACGAAGEGKGTIRVGSKDFTENNIVAEIYALALEDAGYQVERSMNIAGSLIHTSLVNDEIDLYPEYTGTGLLSVLQMDVITDPPQVYNTVKTEYEKRFSLTWLDYAQAEDGQGLFIRTDVAKELGIRTISDLQEHAGELRFASQGEFDQREDGLPALEAVYGPFQWKESNIYDNGLKYKVVESGEADVAPAYTTEGQLAQKDKFTLLEDDKRVWPPYNLAPVVRNNILETYPDIAEVLNRISEKLDTEILTGLNARVDVEKEEYEDVAADFYNGIR